jgi:hypothetical protein
VAPPAAAQPRRAGPDPGRTVPKILLHGDELGDRIAGIVAAYVIWSGLVPEAPKATMLVERMLTRQIGPVGRELIALAPDLPGARA